MFFIAVLLCPLPAFAVEGAVTRRDAFVLIWRSTSRPAEKTSEKPFSDVKIETIGFEEITYAKARGLLDEDDISFRPDDPVTPYDALLWIFRTRSVEPFEHDHSRVAVVLADPVDVPGLAEEYELDFDAEGTWMTRDELLALMRQLDIVLAEEEHEASLYSEKFHGKGTAFGEIFDMNSLTAAHRTFPHNTLVKVTNIDNGKSVTVRINDRGPYVNGRDIDLSLRAFTEIADRSEGKIHATFERLGDANVLLQCDDDRYQRRIVKDVRLTPGIPHSLALGRNLSMTSEDAFVIRDIVYPDGVHAGRQTWITTDEAFEFTPAIPGMYRFLVGTKTGRSRVMRMNVVDCSDVPQP